MNGKASLWVAFANPLSVEVAGNLAFYGLKMDPPRAEESRELAIYALALATRAQGPSPANTTRQD